MRKLPHQLIGYLQHVRLVLPLQAKDHDSGEAKTRVDLDIGKAAVECNQDATFRRADACERRILGSSEILLNDSSAVPTGTAEELRKFLRQILVDFELQAGSPTISSRVRSAAYAMHA